MALVQYNLTLTGVAQSLLEAAPAQTDQYNIPCLEIILQVDDDASNPIFVGDENVTTAVYGIRLPAPTAGIPVAPFIFGPFATGGAMKPNDVFVIGTGESILNIILIPF